MPPNAIAHLDEEWWTTEMVCAFLEIGRKALWERRRNNTLAVPRAYRMAGKRNLYRAKEIKDWATWIAERPLRLADLRGETPRSVGPIEQPSGSNKRDTQASAPGARAPKRLQSPRRPRSEIGNVPLAPTSAVATQAVPPIAALPATKETEGKVRRRRSEKFDPAQLSLF